MNKQLVFTQIKEATARCNPGRCLYASLVGYYILGKIFPDMRVQAGSLHWPILSKEQDDGIQPTHFSYQWDPADFQSFRAVLQGSMPEMHVWLARTSTMEIIDFTTYELQSQCKRLIGTEWKAEAPPDFVWEHIEKLPTDVFYEPDAEATRLAYHYMRNTIQTGFLRENVPVDFRLD